MKFTEDDIKEIGLAIVGIILLAVVFFYSSTFVHKTVDTTAQKPGTTCTQQIAADNSACKDKNNMLFVGCNGFF
jgi:hypothetical protein